MSNIRFFNSADRQTDKFEGGEEVRIYSCGPTVYDYAHIGNMRTFLFEDLLIRTLKDEGYKVRHTRNITDVDDKTIAISKKQNKSLKEFTSFYEKAFFDDLKNLNFDLDSTEFLRATDYIDEMKNLISILIDKGYAYETEDGVYFKSGDFSDYGDFAGLDLQHIKDGASGGEADFEKDDVGDFVIWKKHKENDGDVFWESDWGRGRPGWHTECAAMVRSRYPEGLDIHTGGVDLLFPHHTNEKAHCECMDDRKMSRFWMHATHLLVDGRKMSKSLNNFYTIRDLVDMGYGYKTIRFYLLTGAHYRSPLNFTLEGLKGAESALNRLNNFIFELEKNPKSAEPSTLYKHFTEQLHDDLNISGAMGEIFMIAGDYYNGSLYDTESLLADLRRINNILAVMDFDSAEALEGEALELFNQRIKAREQKNWAESDRLRDALLELGIEVRDGKDGCTYKKI